MKDVPPRGGDRKTSSAPSRLVPYPVEGSVDRLDFEDPWVLDLHPERGWPDAIRARRIVGIAASKGTGKTHAIETWAKKMLDGDPSFQLTVITHRIALGEQLAERFSAAFYRDHRSPRDAERTARTARCLVVSAQSLGKFRARRFDQGMLVVDEAKQVLRALVTPGQGNGIAPGNRRQILDNFLTAVRQSQRTYLLDADLSPQILDRIAALTDIPRTKCLFVRNHFVPERGAVVELPTREALFERLRDTARRSKCLAMSTSKAEAERVDMRLKRAGVKTLLITAGTRATEGVQAFLKDPVDGARDVDVVISSPAIGTGYSLDTLDDSQPLFEFVFLDGLPNRMHVEDLLQMIARVRGDPTVLFYIPRPDEDEAKEPVPTEQEIVDYTFRTWLSTGGKIVAHPDHVQDPRAYALAFFQDLLSLNAFFEHDRLAVNRVARDEFVRRADADGYMVETCEPGRHTKEQKDRRRDAKDAHRDAQVDARTCGLAGEPGEGDEGAARAKRDREVLGRKSDEEFGEKDRPEVELLVDFGEDRILLAELVGSDDGRWRALGLDRAEHGYRRRVVDMESTEMDEEGLGEVLSTKDEYRQRHTLAITPLDARNAILRALLVVMMLKSAGTTPADVLAGRFSFDRDLLLAEFLPLARQYRLALKKHFDITVNPTGDARLVRAMKTLLRQICVTTEEERDGKRRVQVASPHPALQAILARRKAQRERPSTDPIGTNDLDIDEGVDGRRVPDVSSYRDPAKVHRDIEDALDEMMAAMKDSTGEGEPRPKRRQRTGKARAKRGRPGGPPAQGPHKP